MLIQSVTVD